MTKRQSVNSPLDRRGSYTGCYDVVNKGLIDQDCNTGSVSDPRVFVSESHRRKNKTALSLFPKFNALVNRTPTCWLWVAGVDAYGYGQIAVPGHSPMKTHRLAWMFAHGPIPPSVHVLHKCDTPRCVNPDHLFLGDQAANMKDAAAKRRLNVPHLRSRKVSAEAVATIIAAPAVRGVVVQLAKQFGVSKGFVSLVRRGLRRVAPTPAPSASLADPSQPVPLPPSVDAGARG